MTDDDPTARVRDSFDRQGAMATIGAALAHVAPGRVSLVMSHRHTLTRQHGRVHAGMIATMTATVMTVQGHDGPSR